MKNINFKTGKNNAVGILFIFEKTNTNILDYNQIVIYLS